MDVTATSTATAAPAAAATSTDAASGSGNAFAGALGDQQKRLAAADVLGSMPPMVADQIRRSVPGGKAPMGAIQELFKAIKSGEFKPSDQQMAAHDCVIATTARATQVFDSPDDMWATMRDMLGAGPVLNDAVQYAVADQKHTVPETAVSTRDEANAILGGPIPPSKINWWVTAIQFLVNEAHTAATVAVKSAPDGAASAAVGSKPKG